MTKAKIKDLLDFTPLIIITVQASVLLYTAATTDIMLMWKHIAGLILLPLNFVMFWWRHKVGVLALCLTLLTGLLSLISYSPAVVTDTVYIRIFEIRIPVFYGQPIFLLWLVIHFIVSGRHYVAILTKKYWQDLFVTPQKMPHGEAI